MTLREITSEDMVSLEALDKKCFSEAVRYNRHALDFYLSLPNSIGLIQTDNDIILGFIIANMLTDDTFNIVTIDVEPIYRRQGIGTDLIKAVIRIIQEWKMSKISLQVAEDNIPAINFYLKHGFQIMKKLPKYYPHGDGYQMEYLIGDE